MVTVLVQEGQSRQIPTEDAERWDSGSGSPDSMPGESDRALLGVYYQLTEGLEGVEVQQSSWVEQGHL